MSEPAPPQTLLSGSWRWYRLACAAQIVTSATAIVAGFPLPALAVSILTAGVGAYIMHVSLRMHKGRQP